MFFVGVMAVMSFSAASSVFAQRTEPFPDVPDTDAQSLSIKYVVYEGIMQGYPNGTFGPRYPLNRAELMKVLVESAFGKPDDAYARRCFPDVKASDWFSRYVCYAAEHQWVSGYPDGMFRPAQNVTMAEAVKMLVASRAYPLDAPVSWTDDDIRGDAWYSPYLAVALDRFIVSFEGLNVEGKSVLGKPLNRATIAEYIYRSRLSEDAVRLYAGDKDNTCVDQELIGVTLMNKDVDMRDRTGVIMQTLVGIKKDKAICLLATNLNPYFHVSPQLADYILFPLVPDGEGMGGEQTSVGFGGTGKVWFLAGHETSGYLQDMWELDMATYNLRQLPRAKRLTINIAPDYNRIAFITADGRSVVVIDTLSGNRRRTVYTADGALTLAAGISEFGGSPTLYAKDEDLTFDRTKPYLLHVRVYDKRYVVEGGSYDPARSELVTIDLSSSR